MKIITVSHEFRSEAGKSAKGLQTFCIWITMTVAAAFANAYWGGVEHED